MTLWQQMFESAPLEKVIYTNDEFNQAWNWIFQDGYEMAPLRLSIIRTKSLALKRSRIVSDSCECAKMAVVDVWRKQTQIKARSVPPRKQ